MRHRKADVARWIRGQRRAGARVAKAARSAKPELGAALDRVDALRRFADRQGATIDRARAERENLAYHLVWRRVRRAMGVG
jgi:hypothetical protein